MVGDHQYFYDPGYFIIDLFCGDFFTNPNWAALIAAW